MLLSNERFVLYSFYIQRLYEQRSHDTVPIPPASPTLLRQEHKEGGDKSNVYKGRFRNHNLLEVKRAVKSQPAGSQEGSEACIYINQTTFFSGQVKGLFYIFRERFHFSFNLALCNTVSAGGGAYK